MTDATLVVVPVLNRPGNVRPLVDSLAAATPEPHRLLFVTTPGYPDEEAALRNAGASWVDVAHNPIGDYARKINHAYQTSDEPYIFTGADDLRFHPGWLAAALQRMGDPAIGVVGTNDLGNSRVLAGEHSTHSLIRRTYADQYGLIDQPGAIYFDGYWHEYVDDELVGTAKARGAYAHAADSIVEHLHPLWDKAPMDAVYAEQRNRMRKSRQLFRQRQEMWLTMAQPCG